MCCNNLKHVDISYAQGREMWCGSCRIIHEWDGNASAIILFYTIIMQWTGQDYNRRSHAAVYNRRNMINRHLSRQQTIMLFNIMRSLEDRSADGWYQPHLSGAHKPGRQNPVRSKHRSYSGVHKFL